MMPGSGYGDGIQHFKKVKVQLGKQIFRCPLCFRKFAPGIINFLGPTENCVNI